MNCFNHPPQIAVAQCVDCRKGLCSNCATSYSMPICIPCNTNRIKGERSRIIRELLVTYILGALLTFLFVKLLSTPVKEGGTTVPFNTLSYVIIFYISAGLVAGWQTLNRITPRMFLFLPLIGWVIYFVLKLFLAYWVGLVMLPVRTIKNLIRLIRLSKTKV